MVELVHIGAILPATVSVCCTVGGRERHPAVVAPGMVMVLAMLDLSVGPGLIAPFLWAAVMVGLAVWTAVGVRAMHSLPDTAHVRETRRMHLHRALGLVVMAGLTASMSGGVSAAVASVAVTTGHQHAASGILVPVVAAGVAGYLTYTGWIAVVAMARRAMLARVDAASMGVMAAVMGAALLA